jgi:hypothetical protein
VSVRDDYLFIFTGAGSGDFPVKMAMRVWIMDMVVGGVTFDKFFVWNFIVPLSENEKAGVIHKNGIKICVFRLLLFWQKISEHFGLQTTASRHGVLTKT